MVVHITPYNVSTIYSSYFHTFYFIFRYLENMIKLNAFKHSYITAHKYPKRHKNH